MRKVIIFTTKWIFIIGVSFLLINYVFAQDLEPIDESDILIQDIKNDINISQSDYFNNSNTYWQGLITHSSIPSKNKVSYLDNINKRPTYQDSYWIDLVDLPVMLPFSIEVHQYKTAESEHGYQIIFRQFIDGEIFIKAFGYGPEGRDRTYDWKLINTIPD